MPLPYSDHADGISTDVCCTSLWDVAEAWRVLGTDAVLGCMEDSCATEFRSYVTVGEPTDVIGDCLIVSLLNVAVAPSAEGGNQRTLPIVNQFADFALVLLEQGWPAIYADEDEERIHIPDHQVVNAVSKHSYAHGERIWRATVQAVASGSFQRDLGHRYAHPRLAPMTPVASGALAGWRMNMRITVNLAG